MVVCLALPANGGRASPSHRHPALGGSANRSCWDERRMLIQRLRALLGHLEEEQIGQLLYLVAVGHAIIAQQIAVVLEPLHNGLGCITHRLIILPLSQARSAIAIYMRTRPRGARSCLLGVPKSHRDPTPASNGVGSFSLAPDGC